MSSVLEAVKAFGGNYPERYDVGFIFCGERILRCGFNCKVEELSNHAGIELFIEYVKADKKLLEKESKADYTSEEFWKDAPEDCNLAAINLTNKPDDYGLFVYESREFDGYEYCSANRVGPSMDHHKIVKRPKPQSIFTKAMQEAGELPSVGMECLIMYSSSNYKGTITYMGDGVGVYRSKDNNKEYTFALASVKFRALDTRTKKEKAIDDMSKRVFVNKECLSVIYDEWSGNNE